MAKTHYEIKSVGGGVMFIGDKQFPILEVAIPCTEDMTVTPESGCQGVLRVRQSRKEAKNN